MVIPLLDAIEIEGKDVTADAMHTQHKLADYLVKERKAHYHCTVKDNQPTLHQDIVTWFEDRKEPDYIEVTPPDHGRIETRRIWVTDELNGYLNFPHVGQAFLIERETLHKKSGKLTHELAYGITSRTPNEASPERILQVNRGHWAIENSCHYILDWAFDEDRSRIRTGYGPENVTRLRRFAIGLLKSKGAANVTQRMRELAFSVRAVLDLLRLTKNACARASVQPGGAKTPLPSNA